MTGPELLAIGGKTNEAYAWARWSRVVIPLLAALIVMPIFVRFSNRDAIVSGCLKALGGAALPVLVVVVGGMIADTSAFPPMTVVLIAVGLALIPASIVYLRWRL
ncbi:MAG: hypothetical protein H0W83_16225 [Planctomycetes bacterium]|nr:hypothetical protein [Planctomycetota bacterium]